jgi:hypothetical protein
MAVELESISNETILASSRYSSGICLGKGMRNITKILIRRVHGPKEIWIRRLPIKMQAYKNPLCYDYDDDNNN